MAYEALDWAEEPSLTNADDTQNYNMGIRFTVTEETSCLGAQWRVPDALAALINGHVYKVSIWNEVPTRLAVAEFTPTPGVYQDVLFETPITLAPATNYIAAVYTRKYVFRASGGVYPSTPSGNGVADVGRLTASNLGPDDPGSAPTGTSTGLFYVSPLLEVEGEVTGVSPDSLSIAVALGEPSIGYDLAPAPDGLSVPITLGEPASQDGEAAPTPPAAGGSSGGWWSLKNILDEARENLREERLPAVACPYDGEPLLAGHCSYCGYGYQRTR